MTVDTQGSGAVDSLPVFFSHKAAVNSLRLLLKCSYYYVTYNFISFK